MPRLTRLRAGSYEFVAPNGDLYFTYSYRAEDGTGLWWALYVRPADRSDEDMLSARATLGEIRSDITNHLTAALSHATVEVRP